MANTRRNKAQRRLDLRNAFSGVALTERDQRLLDWLATCDKDTTTALAALNRSSRLDLRARLRRRERFERADVAVEATAPVTAKLPVGDADDLAASFRRRIRTWLVLPTRR